MSDNFEQRYQDKHKKISMVKSGIRIAACVLALVATSSLGGIIILSVGFLIAELLGIAEEMI